MSRRTNGPSSTCGPRRRLRRALALQHKLAPLSDLIFDEPIVEAVARIKAVLKNENLIAHDGVRAPQMGIGAAERRRTAQALCGAARSEPREGRCRLKRARGGRIRAATSPTRGAYARRRSAASGATAARATGQCAAAPSAKVDKPQMKSLSTALQVLREFVTAQQPFGVVELSERLGLRKGQISKILRAFRQQSFLEQDPTTRKYSVGINAFALGNNFVNSNHCRANRCRSCVG